jgi:hypothetical protein
MLDHPRDWDDLDEQQQWLVLRQLLERLAAFSANGAIKHDNDEGKLFFSGRYLERPFRLGTDTSRWFTLEVKVDNSSEVLDILNNVQLDKDKHPQAPQERDEWSEDKVVFFLAPGVYLEGTADSVEADKAALARHGAGLPALLSGFVQATEGQLTVSEDRVELRFCRNIDELPNFAGLVQGSLDFLAQIFRGFGV